MSKRPQRGKITAIPAGDLPRWVRDEVTRTAPKARREPALIELGAGVDAYAAGRFGKARDHLKRAKELAPQAATIRELLGLSMYEMEQWQPALSELRTFRRIAGDPVHMPVEMDCLRALGRDRDVENTWDRFRKLDAPREVQDEVRVVYGSHLLEHGRVREAWKVVEPGRLVASPSGSTVRRWFVAARIAVAAHDERSARKLIKAIADQDEDFPGLLELRSQMGGA